MPAIQDFRGFAFDVKRIDASGKDLGKKVYLQLYAIENIVRVIVHSVLVAQVGTGWWAIAVDPTMRGNVARRQRDYANRPWHSTPGRHEIYYAFLSDLNKIMTANSHLFQPVIPDIDQWIARIEQIRLPRNIVGHMNWLTATDRSRIDVFHSDAQHLANHLGQSGLTLTIP